MWVLLNIQEKNTHTNRYRVQSVIDPVLHNNTNITDVLYLTNYIQQRNGANIERNNKISVGNMYILSQNKELCKRLGYEKIGGTIFRVLLWHRPTSWLIQGPSRSGLLVVPHNWWVNCSTNMTQILISQPSTPNSPQLTVTYLSTLTTSDLGVTKVCRGTTTLLEKISTRFFFGGEFWYTSGEYVLMWGGWRGWGWQQDIWWVSNYPLFWKRQLCRTAGIHQRRHHQLPLTMSSLAQ